jgi:predicted nucleic acid-binding protein
MIVLDANILIRAVLGRRVRNLLDIWAAKGIRFFAPDVAFDDAAKYLPPLLARRGKPIADVAAAPDWIRTLVEPVTPELYALFEGEARQRIDDRDENDWLVIATAMALACASGRRMPTSSVPGLPSGQPIGLRSCSGNNSKPLNGTMNDLPWRSIPVTRQDELLTSPRVRSAVRAGIQQNRHNQNHQINARNRHVIVHHQRVDNCRNREKDEAEQRNENARVSAHQYVREQPHQDQNNARGQQEYEQE